MPFRSSNLWRHRRRGRSGCVELAQGGSARLSSGAVRSIQEWVARAFTDDIVISYATLDPGKLG